MLGPTLTVGDGELNRRHQSTTSWLSDVELRVKSCSSNPLSPGGYTRHRQAECSPKLLRSWSVIRNKAGENPQFEDFHG